MRNVVFLSLTAAMALYVSPAQAERPTQKKETASHVAVGKVERVYVYDYGSTVNYLVKLKVESVERGEGVSKDDAIYIECFQRKKDAPPEPSASGHLSVPAVGDRIRAYTNRFRGTHEGIYQDWYEKLP